jgi:hypothetical protein
VSRGLAIKVGGELDLDSVTLLALEVELEVEALLAVVALTAELSTELSKAELVASLFLTELVAAAAAILSAPQTS